MVKVFLNFKGEDQPDQVSYYTQLPARKDRILHNRKVYKVKQILHFPHDIPTLLLKEIK